MSDIYLDNNATTKVDHAVVDVMIPYFLEQYGNPSSIHKFADGVARGLKHARQAKQTEPGKVMAEESCDKCDAESVCIPRKESPVKLAARA